jgi:hypothetical protein
MPIGYAICVRCSNQARSEYLVRISYVEIYNEDVRDLLAGKDSKTLQAMLEHAEL